AGRLGDDELSRARLGQPCAQALERVGRATFDRDVRRGEREERAALVGVAAFACCAALARRRVRALRVRLVRRGHRPAPELLRLREQRRAVEEQLLGLEQRTTAVVRQEAVALGGL